MFDMFSISFLDFYIYNKRDISLEILSLELDFIDFYGSLFQFHYNFKESKDFRWDFLFINGIRRMYK